MSHPWNWCRKCQQLVDIPEDTFDGSEVRCWGCHGWFVVVAYEDGSFRLRKVKR